MAARVSENNALQSKAEESELSTPGRAGDRNRKLTQTPEAISENADTGNPPEDKQIAASTVAKIRSYLRRRCLQARVELFRRRSGCFSAAAKRKQASSAMFQCAILHGRVAKARF